MKMYSFIWYGGLTFCLICFAYNSFILLVLTFMTSFVTCVMTYRCNGIFSKFCYPLPLNMLLFFFPHHLSFTQPYLVHHLVFIYQRKIHRTGYILFSLDTCIKRNMSIKDIILHHIKFCIKVAHFFCSCSNIMII